MESPTYSRRAALGLLGSALATPLLGAERPRRRPCPGSTAVLKPPPSTLAVEEPQLKHETPEEPRLSIIDRQISQNNGQWIVRYTVKYDGREPLLLERSRISMNYESWVSNSSLPPHSVPRRSMLQFSLAENREAYATVISSPNDRQCCRERIAVALRARTKGSTSWEFPEGHPVSETAILPRQQFDLFLRLDHDHFLYGAYDPLLGERKVEIQLGPCRLRDTIPLDTEQAPATPEVKLNTPPKARMDQRQFRSAPDSLGLAADVPGYQYFRFDDMPVRFSTEFRLRFWYLIAHGTEGYCHARIMEYQDTPNAWYRLDGGFDEQLKVQKQWQSWEKTFRTLPETTTVALDFRICGSNVGEVWVDDIELTPLYAGGARRTS